MKQNALEFLYWLISEVEGPFLKYQAYISTPAAIQVLEDYFQNIQKLAPNFVPEQSQEYVGEAILCSLPKISSLPQNVGSLKPVEPLFTKQDKILVWVDDHPENNKVEMQAAEKAGVKLFTFTTNYAVKVWLYNHGDVLEEMSPDNFLIVTDRHRDAQSVKEDKMASDKPCDTFKDYIRNKLNWSTPIMIYCGNPTSVKHLHSPASKVYVNTDRKKCVPYVTMAPLSSIYP